MNRIASFFLKVFLPLALLPLGSCLYPAENWGFEVEVSASLSERTFNTIELKCTYEIVSGEGQLDGGGVCYSTTSKTPSKGDKTRGGTLGKSAFNVTLDNLASGTTYYVRPYVYSGACYIYGDVLTVMTRAEDASTPVFGTPEVSDLTTTSATLSVACDYENNDYPLQACGFAYCLGQETPTVNDGVLTGPLSDGRITISLNYLSENTLYTARPFVQTGKGTFYGQAVSFSTLSTVWISEVSASLNGSDWYLKFEIKLADAGAEVSDASIRWSADDPNTMTSSCAISSLYQQDGTWYASAGMGSFVSRFVQPVVQVGGELFCGSVSKVGDLVVTYGNTSFTMVAVNGGTFQMGATDAQLNAPVNGLASSADASLWGDLLEKAMPLQPLRTVYKSEGAGLRAAAEPEKPAHAVTLSDYYIGQTEVTQQLWKEFYSDWSVTIYAGDNLPTHNINWYKAVDFADRLSQATGYTFVLPTEAQWEFAARGGNSDLGADFKYSGSNAIEEVAWYKENATEPQAVGQRAPNQLGIYDMSGNVGELCYDWYDASYYASSPAENPAGPDTGTVRVRRGGDYYNAATWARVSARSSQYPDSSYLNRGFRLAMIPRTVEKASVGTLTAQYEAYSSESVWVEFSLKVLSAGSGRVSEVGMIYSTTGNNMDLYHGIVYSFGTPDADGEIACWFTVSTDHTYALRPYAITEYGVSYGDIKWYTSPSAMPVKEAVDLGLPSGLKWATCNVGASSPEDYGDYFAWGETTTKSSYDWSTYKWCNGSYDTQTKYNTDSSYGTVDNKTVLDLEDDAARANWGGNWRMPTDEEFVELYNNCTWTWTTQNGVNGYKVTSNNNGNSVFFPAAGFYNASSLYFGGSSGYYWSSLLTDFPYSACSLDFDSSYVGPSNGYSRRCGLSVRAVSE